MQERNLCLQGRMGRFSEWSSVSFNVTITNFFGTIERFGITLTSLQQTSHSDWQLLKLGQKVKAIQLVEPWEALFCRPRAVVLLSSEARTASKKVKSPSIMALGSLTVESSKIRILKYFPKRVVSFTYELRWFTGHCHVPLVSGVLKRHAVSVKAVRCIRGRKIVCPQTLPSKSS